VAVCYSAGFARCIAHLIQIESMLNLDPLIWSLAAALGIGLLIGTERERRKGTGPRRSAAGLRTFTLASLTGAVSVITGGAPLLGIATAGIFGLAALAYWRGETDDPGLTSEIALVSTTLLGGLAVIRPWHAAGIAVAVAILLNARTELHRFTRAVLSEEEIRDALIFAAATLIILPLLPDQQMGPYGALNPRTIWIIVILVMGIGALGHIAVRLVGARYGLPLGGFASGFISGTATIAAMGGRAAHSPEVLWPASAGAVLSSVGTIVQLALVLTAANIEVLGAVAVPLALGGAVAALYGFAFLLFALGKNSGGVDERGRAFSPWAAAIFAAMLAAILLVSRAMNEWFGASGVAATAALAGLASVDPAAISVATLARAGKIAASDAPLPILIALSTNTITKAVLAMSAGSFGFALRVLPGLTLVILAVWTGWWLLGQP
jgi:uncharacterized membrane protein (DUF4010 family)